MFFFKMSGLWFLAVFSPAIHCSSDRKNRRLPFLSGLKSDGLPRVYRQKHLTFVTKPDRSGSGLPEVTESGTEAFQKSGTALFLILNIEIFYVKTNSLWFLAFAVLPSALLRCTTCSLLSGL